MSNIYTLVIQEDKPAKIIRHGTQGPRGPMGNRGNTILSGESNPTATDGIDGDYFINTLTYNFYGPKQNGEWNLSNFINLNPSGPQPNVPDIIGGDNINITRDSNNDYIISLSSPTNLGENSTINSNVIIQGVGTKKITVGPTAPESPQIGDIWIDTT